jgi:hypothetical protein
MEAANRRQEQGSLLQMLKWNSLESDVMWARNQIKR